MDEMSYFGILSPCDAMTDLIGKYRLHRPIFYGPVILSYLGVYLSDESDKRNAK